MASPSNSSKWLLLLFDIDGTLISGSNSTHKNSFHAALMQEWGVDKSLADIEHSGRTDFYILKGLLKLGGVADEAITPARVAATQALMVQHCRDHANDIPGGLRVLPGVPELLNRLAALPDIILGLVTGNLEPIARLKLEAIGLAKFFVDPSSQLLMGGFGDATEDRAALIARAVAHASEAYGAHDGRVVYHTGDTQLDVEAAARFGARGVGVATGHVPAAVLAGLPCGSWRVVADLRDTDALVDMYTRPRSTDDAPQYPPRKVLRKVVVIPGNGAGCASSNFYPRLAELLRAEGVRVELREMPEGDAAPRAVWLPFITNVLSADADTVLVGHSSGAVAGLRFAETRRLAALVVVSATPSDLGIANEAASGYYDGAWLWGAVRANCPRVVLFASTDDPFIPLATQREVRDGLVAGGRSLPHKAHTFEYVELDDRSHFFDEEQPEIFECVMRLCKEVVPTV